MRDRSTAGAADLPERYGYPMERSEPVRRDRQHDAVLKKKQLAPGVLEAARDRQGRIVRLTEKGMKHVARSHRELDGCEIAIATAIENAEFRCRSKRPGREVLYASNLGPARWLAVVVAYDGTQGEVITAYGSKKGPQEADLI